MMNSNENGKVNANSFNLKDCLASLFLGLIIIPAYSIDVLAHGSHINYETTEAIKIQATYDDGKPMADAQVVIYSPDDLEQPKIQGNTDAEGYFVFIPDQEGNWDIKVRQGGHGEIITIPVEKEKIVEETEVKEEVVKVKKSEANNPTPNYTQMQKLMMAATGVWGFVGTALFFSRSKK